MPENTLPYPINDADNHFNEPPDCFERYIDPSKADLAIRSVRRPTASRCSCSPVSRRSSTATR